MSIMKKNYLYPHIIIGTVFTNDIYCETIAVSGKYSGGEIEVKRKEDNEDEEFEMIQILKEMDKEHHNGSGLW